MLEHLKELREEVYRANMMLKEHDLIIFTWGNVSGIDKNREYVVIKPSGVEYDNLTPENMAVVNMRGEIIEGDLKPSSDTATHLELYKAYKNLGGVCHTHSLYATSFAQSFLYTDCIEPYGTTHADYFDGAVPVTRKLKKKEIEKDYEKNTGLVIIETLKKYKITPEEMPAVLVKSHGPFTFGKNALESAENSVVLETVAHMAFNTEMLSHAGLKRPVGYNLAMQKELLRKHFDRKHGANAYYGQDKK